MLTGPACRAAVLGSPVAHSHSPVLHRAAYAALGLHDWAYDRFAVGGQGEPSLEEFLPGCGPQWLAFSVTMPLKEDALRLAVAASGHARQVGAANTLIRGEHGWIADSTDATGALEAMVEAGVGAPRRALVLGAGATARSVLDALARLGVCSLTLATRSGARPQTEALARALGLRVAEIPLAHPGDLARAVAAADVSVSTLPGGTRLALPPVAADALAGRHVMDVVYADWPTPFAAWAGAGGATLVSGLDMLIHQAAAQVHLMTGRQAPLAAMREAVRPAR